MSVTLSYEQKGSLEADAIENRDDDLKGQSPRKHFLVHHPSGMQSRNPSGFLIATGLTEIKFSPNPRFIAFPKRDNKHPGGHGRMPAALQMIAGLSPLDIGMVTP